MPKSKNFILATCALSISFVAQAAGTSSIKLNIEGQPLDTALREFARQTGMQVLYPPDSVTERIAPAVEGRLTAEAALNALLEDSGLRFAFINEKTISVSPAIAEATSGAELAGARTHSPAPAAHAAAARTESFTIPSTASMSEVPGADAISPRERPMKRAEALHQTDFAIVIAAVNALSEKIARSSDGTPRSPETHGIISVLFHVAIGILLHLLLECVPKVRAWMRRRRFRHVSEPGVRDILIVIDEARFDPKTEQECYYRLFHVLLARISAARSEPPCPSDVFPRMG